MVLSESWWINWLGVLVLVVWVVCMRFRFRVVMVSRWCREVSRVMGFVFLGWGLVFNVLVLVLVYCEVVDVGLVGVFVVLVVGLEVFGVGGVVFGDEVLLFGISILIFLLLLKLLWCCR